MEKGPGKRKEPKWNVGGINLKRARRTSSPEVEGESQ